MTPGDVPAARVVVLLRHGETPWSLAGRHTGRSDVPLSDAGREEARAAGRRLAAVQVRHVLCSPLVRARETCELAGFGEDPQLDDALVEWDYGAYEGRTTTEIRAGRPGWSLFADGCPDGESAADVGARVDPLVARLRDGEGAWLLVAHGHVLRVLAARWAGLEPQAGALLALDTAAICVLGLEHGAPVLRRWNETGDLP
ncbi:MAG TPA: histidine phosphatase family protein [Solirubrobacteraceae bacterium]